MTLGPEDSAPFGVVGEIAALKDGIRRAMGPEVRWTFTSSGVSRVVALGEAPLVIGRTDLPDDEERRSVVSRRHVQLWRVDKALFARDLGTLNGSVVLRSGVRLPVPSEGELELVSGDRLFVDDIVELGVVHLSESEPA